MVNAIAMSAKTQNILANVGHPWAFHTGRDAVGEVKPGHVVGCIALTADTYDVELPDAANDFPAAVALRNPEHDIDTAYSLNDEFEIALVGGGHLVWGFSDSQKGNKMGTKMATAVGGTGTLTDITEANKLEFCAIKFGEDPDYANT
ncbi:MAG: hypothetical protein ACXACE_16850, partial [Candidatus Thorarchaeota archaeon]